MRLLQLKAVLTYFHVKSMDDLERLMRSWHLRRPAHNLCCVKCMFPWASAFFLSLLILKVLLRIEKTVEAIEPEKWSQTCILCPWEIVSSWVSYICSGFKWTETPRSGTEEGKERPKRHPLALKYNPPKGKVETTRIRSNFESKNLRYIAKLFEDLYVRDLNCKARNRNRNQNQLVRGSIVLRVW